MAGIDTDDRPASGLRRLDHFAIHVTDLERAADWYARVLGFRLLRKWEESWMLALGR